MNLYIYNQLIFNKSAKTIQWGMRGPVKSSIPRYMPKRMENICPQKNLHTNVHSCIIANSQKAENNLNAHQLMNGQTKCFISIRLNIIPPGKRVNSFTLQYTETWKRVLSERIRAEKITWLHWYEMPTTGGSLETERRWAVAGLGGGAMGCGFPFSDD